MEANRIGTQIRYYRKSLGLSQDALAQAAGLSRGMIAYIETGERLPSLDTTLPKICEVLGLDFDVTLRMK